MLLLSTCSAYQTISVSFFAEDNKLIAICFMLFWVKFSYVQCEIAIKFEYQRTYTWRWKPKNLQVLSLGVADLSLHISEWFHHHRESDEKSTLISIHCRLFVVQSKFEHDIKKMKNESKLNDSKHILKINKIQWLKSRLNDEIKKRFTHFESISITFEWSNVTNTHGKWKSI